MIDSTDLAVKYCNLNTIAASTTARATNTVNGVSYSYDYDYDYDKIYENIMKKFSFKPTVEHKCHNCGATLVLESDKHIFKCQYCDAVYAIGTQLINDRG